jgi:hypothetical protein
MTVRSADLRFVLPHHVRRALVLGVGTHPHLAAMAAGFEEAGIDVIERPLTRGADRPDVVIATGGDAVEALRLAGRAHLLVGRPPTGLRRLPRTSVPLLLRGDPAAPRLVIPLAPNTALRHHLRQAAPRHPLGRSLSRSLATLAQLPMPARVIVPSRALVSLVLPPGDERWPPAVLQAATEVGLRTDGGWLLRLGTGDVLKRAVFHVLDGDRPGWVVKFSRVAGYDRPFLGDAAGLALARTAGGPVAAHAPAHLGLLDVGGLTASVETAAVGTQLTYLLRRRPWRLIDAIVEWTGAVGRHTAQPAHDLEPERTRLRQLVSEVGVSLGAPADLVDRVSPVPAVLQHNDLGSWNILSDGSGFTALDWESARESSFPLWDLFYFAADVLTRIDGPADANTLLDRTLRLFAGESAHSGRLFRWVREAAQALEVPTAALGPLATLCWLHHAQSPARRDVDLRGAAAAPLGHHPRLCPAWFGHPGLGASWTALTR